jgi:lipopolysaccharide transport system permease protein
MRLFRQLLDSLHTHRAVLWQFTLRNVELRSKGSHLGLLWSLLGPLIMLGLYVLVFGYIFGGSFGVVPDESRADYGLGIFLGLALFNFANDMLCNTVSLVTDNPNFVKKVVFPLEVLPAAAVGAAAFHLLVTLALVALGMVFFGRGLGLSALLLVPVLLPLLMGALGAAWFLAAVGVFFRDLRQILPVVGTALMFASAIFYSSARIPPAAYSFLKYNPLLHAIENARDVVLWGRPLDPWGMGYLYLCGVLAMFAGFWTFQKLKPAFADVL